MHPTILVKRKADAIHRILTKADALATRLELDPALIEALQPQGIKDPRVVEMKRLEALADLLDQLAVMAGVTEPVAVTVETAATPADSEPLEETLPDPAPIGEDLPPPVIEEGESDLPAEEAPTQAESIPKASKKSTRGKRSRK